ncbi:MAG: hypothetical protein HY347_01285 [candidate division NC10 bacterium]|nr:hypothetical protein [candidate division NC10 bacterium]
MDALCTYCSKEKRHDPGEMPAILRYKSERITHVHTAALALRAGFFILSGKFGLVTATHPIPDYDHLLQDPEVEAHAKKVGEQLAQAQVCRLVYVTEPISEVPQLGPYLETIRRACSATSVALFVFPYRP